MSRPQKFKELFPNCEEAEHGVGLSMYGNCLQAFIEDSYEYYIYELSLDGNKLRISDKQDPYRGVMFYPTTAEELELIIKLSEGWKTGLTL